MQSVINCEVIMWHMTVSVLRYIAQYYSHLECQTSGYVMDQLAHHQHLTAEACVQSQHSLCGGLL